MYTSYDKNFLHFLKQSHFCDLLQCKFWIAELQYLADIFQHLNILNTSMQGKGENVLTSTDKIKAFQKKLHIWKSTAIKGSLEMFPLVTNTCKTEILPLVVEHLPTLEEKLNFYFPSLNTAQYDWIRNPFLESTSEYSLTLTEEELAAVSTDRGLMMKYKESSLEAFWISIRKEHVAISKKALTVLLQFSTSYLCELGFSTLATIKCKKERKSAMH